MKFKYYNFRPIIVHKERTYLFLTSKRTKLDINKRNTNILGYKISLKNTSKSNTYNNSETKLYFDFC